MHVFASAQDTRIAPRRPSRPPAATLSPEPAAASVEGSQASLLASPTGMVRMAVLVVELSHLTRSLPTSAKQQAHTQAPRRIASTLKEPTPESSPSKNWVPSSRAAVVVVVEVKVVVCCTTVRVGSKMASTTTVKRALVTLSEIALWSAVVAALGVNARILSMAASARASTSGPSPAGMLMTYCTLTEPANRRGNNSEGARRRARDNVTSTQFAGTLANEAIEAVTASLTWELLTKPSGSETVRSISPLTVAVADVPTPSFVVVVVEVCDVVVVVVIVVVVEAGPQPAPDAPPDMPPETTPEVLQLPPDTPPDTPPDKRRAMASSA
mmetsp:Transcript_63741/g.207062  ORF Transcript_63741/g.207062 Transcript_63741/m.207062 type:complete len:326 (+) Transcript_63741:197-1174(+)